MGVTRDFAAQLLCPDCAGILELFVLCEAPGSVHEGVLRCACGRFYPVIRGVPRVLPVALEGTLAADHPDFFAQYVDLVPPSGGETGSVSERTLRSFGDEWQRFPELHAVHERIFHWYFDGPDEVRWKELRVLDAGCGMGRWLHFARGQGAECVGMDVSKAVDVAAARAAGDFVQADLRYPPFPPASFDLVYCLGVLHHLEDPVAGLRALATLVRAGGELRFYVYRSLEGEHWARRALLTALTALRTVTTRIPYSLVSILAAGISVVATVTTVLPRRWLRRFEWGDRLTRGLPLVHYADVPFRMLVAEQFDRLVAPIEGRFRRDELEKWIEVAQLELVAVLPGLGWRVIARKAEEPKLTQ